MQLLQRTTRGEKTDDCVLKARPAALTPVPTAVRRNLFAANEVTNMF
jgi:hypothetical protein